MSENRRRRNNGAQNTQVKKARTNNARRILLLVGLMSIVAVISIGGTIAWLTDKTPAVTNTFTSSDITISIAETNAVKDETTGNLSNSYQMVPGRTITKDPKITVQKGSEKCWLFAKVEKKNSFDSFMTYSIAEGWTELTTGSGIYYRIVNASEAADDMTFDVIANNTVTVSTNVTKAKMNALTEATYPQLVVSAYACQYEGFAVDATHTEREQAQAAWNAAQPTT